MSKRFIIVLAVTIIAAIFSPIIYGQKQLAQPVVLQVAIHEGMQQLEITYVVNKNSNTQIDKVMIGDAQFFFNQPRLLFNEGVQQAAVFTTNRYYEVRSREILLDDLQLKALQDQLHLVHTAQVYFDGYLPIDIRDKVEIHGLAVQDPLSIIKKFGDSGTVEGRMTFKVKENVTIEDITIQHQIAKTTLLSKEKSITFPLQLRQDETFTIDFQQLYSYGDRRSPIRIAIKLVNEEGQSLVIHEEIESGTWMTDEILEDFLKEAEL